jgi:NAD(P)H-flavin reductase/ferredoxin
MTHECQSATSRERPGFSTMQPMFSFFTRKGPSTAHINAVSVTVQPKETLLQAALRQGIDFPHSCRVGGCAACKCKLVDGKVKELTRTSYVLSDDDLDQGYILACQSVPQGDVRVEVDLSAQAARRRVGGRVIAQERLTHDIVRLRVQLDESLPYKAGQFADIGIDSLPGMSRSYSFATPMQPDAQVSFFVRKVPGGQFSSHVNDASLVGQTMSVEGPMGSFWLRPSDAPLMLIAGGSGLAPVLAILRDGLGNGIMGRPVTLLFGARREADLYALDEIRDIARQWSAPFHFEPVLSDEPTSSSWQGARGLVTERIAPLLEGGAHAYLCGPPAMIDVAVNLLVDRSVPREHIHTDRFTTLQDVAATAA